MGTVVGRSEYDGKGEVGRVGKQVEEKDRRERGGMGLVDRRKLWSIAVDRGLVETDRGPRG